MADILLSYERTDQRRVAPIVALLEARGWSVQWEPAADAGEEPPAAACIIAAWSIDSTDSDAVLAVASYALSRGVLISLSIDFSQPPRGLEQAPSLALAGWSGDESSPRAQELLTAVGELLAQSATKSEAQPAAGAGHARAAVAQAAEPAAVFEREPDSEPDLQPAFASEPEPEPEPAYEPDPASELEPAFEPEPKPAFEVEPEHQPEPAAGYRSAERVPHLVPDAGAAEPVWSFPEETEEERSRSRLPPVLLRDRVQRALPPDNAPPPSRARRGAAVALVAGLVIVAAAAAGLILATGWLGGGAGPGSEVAAVEVAPKVTPEAPPKVAPEAPPKVTPQATPVATARPEPKPAATPTAPPVRPQEAKPQEAKPQEAEPKEVQPTPTALPQDKGLEIEDILGQVTPRVEELLADATRLISIGDIRGARKVLAAPETAQSGSLTFLLAETYDPNILPATLKGAMADSARARALYRKARDLGDGRAKGRLDALKTGGWLPADARRVAHGAAPAGPTAC